ncbi:unnamed protein product [Arctia plantaginis]|uniref:Uncharacterized protein n=1 Tax=Arctia plantaginis TaxID=874455 RepID=A0A8S1B1U0_ARCPL|nr:unnamed protein product [Arctia plantaginis]
MSIVIHDVCSIMVQFRTELPNATAHITFSSCTHSRLLQLQRAVGMCPRVAAHAATRQPTLGGGHFLFLTNLFFWQNTSVYFGGRCITDPQPQQLPLVALFWIVPLKYYHEPSCTLIVKSSQSK